MSLGDIEIGKVWLFPRERLLWIEVAESEWSAAWTVAEAKAAVAYLQAWIAEEEAAPQPPVCRCGHRWRDHMSGLCLSTLDCLCQGWSPDEDGSGARSQGTNPEDAHRPIGDARSPSVARKGEKDHA